MSNTEQPWQIAKREAEERKQLLIKFPFLGKKVRRKAVNIWEEGIVVLDSFEGEEQEQFIEYAPDDREQLYGLPFQVWDDEKNSWVEG